jgi:hypothetical protein
MADEHDRPLTDEEIARAREGQALIAAAVAGVHAPQSLREAIERDRERAAERARAPFWRRRPLAVVSAGAAVVALAVVAIAIQTSENPAEPPLAKVYAAARLGATEPAPAPVGGTPPELGARVGVLDFPDWEKSFGWKAVGRRDDTLSGRPVTTVFYRNPDGARIGYAVVSGDTLAAKPPGRRVTRKGKLYHVGQLGGRTVVTWNQQGHTCVIVAPSGVPRTRVIELAASRNV